MAYVISAQQMKKLSASRDVRLNKCEVKNEICDSFLISFSKIPHETYVKRAKMYNLFRKS